MRGLPPIDAHAHVATDIGGQDLRALRALVFAMTREPSDWAPAVHRADDWTVWGLGCHPGRPSAASSFDADQLRELATGTSLFGEIGLDGRSRTPAPLQRAILSEIIQIAGANGCVTSVHSSGAAEATVELLRRNPIPGVILHWWRGTPEQTRVAVELGCFFSMNAAEVKTPKVLPDLPRDRVLTETDFPHTRRHDPSANRPGQVGTVERALAAAWDEDLNSVRRQVWRNLAVLFRSVGATDALPRTVRAAILTAAG